MEDHEASKMFQQEQIALIKRWSKDHGAESDLSDEEILDAVELALSTWFNKVMICFEPLEDEWE